MINSWPQCIHALFETQVERTPDTIAVLYPATNSDQKETEQLTYRELNRRANQLAHYLRALGIGPESLVGICVDRSIEMMVGLLGILKAGGAYIPLDPAYPRERLAFMLQDANAAILLTQTHLLAKLPERAGRTICLDTEWELIARQSEQNPVIEATAENLAYVIYTSGSTGLPKGVTIQHGSLVNYTLAANIEYGLGAGDRVLQFASISWDTSVEEIYSCLTTGATLVLRPPLMLDSISVFQQKCREWKLTVLNLPTAYWHEWVAELSSNEALPFPSSLHLVIIGGERAFPERLVIWQKHAGSQVRLVNTYGLTEVTAVTTMAELSQAFDLAAEVPIGGPIANTGVYVLDKQHQPVPVGLAGELYIGGAGLARGYLNRPDLTAEKFIPHPFSHEPGARLYKTGDLARYLAEGTLEFLGRRDEQVKVRGFRIELGEIEAVLRQHPLVEEAVVRVWEAGGVDKRLVGYVVWGAGGEGRMREVRRYLEGRLPEYMVPGILVTLEEVPLTPNGKLDRHALPPPEQAEPTLAPTVTRMQAEIATVWAEVLGLKRVSIHDDFFELGGHSLLAMRIISRLREVFGLEISLPLLFELPTVAGLADYFESTQPAESRQSSPALAAVLRNEYLPPSFAQESLWFLDQLQPQTALYNIPIAVLLKGSLNLKALRQSFDEIVRRHEALRTTFHTIEGQPIQVIAPTQTLTLPLVDLRNVPEFERAGKISGLAAEEAQHPFDLGRGPLLRVTLLKLAEAEHVLLLTIHHIISDEWSLQVLFQELEMLYEAFCTGKLSSLPELPIQYADFAHWQRQWLEGKVLETQLTYWKDQLEGYPTVLELLTDRPRSAIQSFRGATQMVMLPKALSEALKAFSQEAGVTLFMTLLAAFQTLLYRYTGQTDIVVGSPIANRTRLELEGLIGFFVNTLVFRTQFSQNLNFRELVRQVHEVALGAYSHQDLPFELLVKELQPERNLSLTPLFQVMFAFQNEAPLATLKLSGLAVNPIEVASETAKFDLTLFMEETEDQLKAVLEYRTDLFDDATMARLLQHFQTLLEGIVAAPERCLWDLPLLTETERGQLLFEWNYAEETYPIAKTFQQLFEEQAERTPEAIAVIFEETQLSYRDLNAQANQLAHYLQALGVGPETLVGICVERSMEMMIGLLGILKAGGAYVPLDPEYPSERLAFMIKDARLLILLTQQRLLTRLPRHEAQVILLDTHWQKIAQESRATPINQATPDNLAYVIYTSGSTGKPKGVLIPQRGLVNYLTWCTTAYQVEAGEGAPVHSSISFDLTITSLFAPLLVGRKVYLLPHDFEVNTLNSALRNRANFSLVKLTPSHLELVSQQLAPQEAAGQTRAFIIGGENLLAESIAFWQDAAPDTLLINEYGPTETVVGCCVYEIPPAQQRSGAVPIGGPIANTEVYVLDKQHQPVPVGLAGELYIGGAGLARGYLNRPDLTAEKFIPHPFSHEPGARLYKTGDLARYLAEGTLEFLGRRDEQVKVRGFRIELGEIEAVLRQHPLVEEAVVRVWEAGGVDKRLVGYVVWGAGGEGRMREVRRYLEGRLPEYMVPGILVTLEEVPLTPNGKLDRHALPPPEQLYFELEKDFAAPQDTLELRLAKLWESFLNVQPIGIKDNFFELGGHSLLAVRLFAQIERVFGQNIPVATLFRAPTVEQLADVLRQGGVTPQSSLVPIQLGDSRPPLFCIHGMGGGILNYTDLAYYLGPDQPFYGIQERGLNGLHAPFTEIETMASHYVDEIRNVQPEGPYFLGGYCLGGTIAFEMARQFQAQGQKVALLAIMDNTSPSLNYHRITLGPGYAIEFLRNLSHWLDDFLQLRPDQRWARLRRKAKVVQQRIINIFTLAGIESFQANIEAEVDADLSHIPEEHYKFLVAHYCALQDYTPQIYQGQIVLFRTPRESLFGPFDPEMGWGELVTQGIKIKVIPGFHANLLQKPYVQILAKQLRSCLDEAQAVNEAEKPAEA